MVQALSKTDDGIYTIIASMISNIVHLIKLTINSTNKEAIKSKKDKCIPSTKSNNSEYKTLNLDELNKVPSSIRKCYTDFHIIIKRVPPISTTVDRSSRSGNNFLVNT